MKNEDIPVPDRSPGKRLHFNSHYEPISFEIENVLFFKGDRGYTKAYMECEKEIISITHNLCYLEIKLKNEDFLRCHKSWLINVQKIKSFYRKKRFLIIADFGIPVSRRNWKATCRILSDKGIKALKILDPNINIYDTFIQY